MLNRYVFSFRLKLERVSADLTGSGRLFHTVGPATEKARSPIFLQTGRVPAMKWRKYDVGVCVRMRRQTKQWAYVT